MDQSCAGASFLFVGEDPIAVEGADGFSGEKTELSLFADLQRKSLLEFDGGAGKVGAGADADIGAAALDEGADFLVAAPLSAK